MADQKISQLTNITGANLADNDEFVVVDTDAGVTKAVTRAEFFKATPEITTSNDIKLTSIVNNIEVAAGDILSYLDFDFPEVATANPTVRFFRDTNTTGTPTVVFYSGDGTSSTDHRINCGGGSVYFQAISGNFGIGTASPSEKLDVVGNVTISGSLSKGSGSFKIDHPLKPDTHYLVHSFLEGPQADNIYRGKVTLVDGTAIVNLDEAARMTDGTFVALNGNIQCFTSNESGWTAVRGSVVGNVLTIEAQDATCTDEVSWLVIGERIDQHMIETSWTDDAGRIITEPEKPQEPLEE